MAESGTHEQLINRDGLYSELWSAQETLFANGDEKGVMMEGKDTTKVH